MAGRLSIATQFLRQKNSADNVVERIRIVKLIIHRVSLTLKSRGEWSAIGWQTGTRLSFIPLSIPIIDIISVITQNSDEKVMRMPHHN
jgi:hypothetical protein